MVLGFWDLVQLRLARSFLQAGVTSQYLRRAISAASEALNTSHPFASLKFKTDGRQILMTYVDEIGDKKLIEIVSKQYQFRDIVDPFLKDIEFNERGEAAIWRIGYAVRRSSRVVLDPHRSFGQPIDRETGVQTQVLAKAVEAEGSPEKAARAFDVPLKAVQDAVAFEARLAA